MTEPITARQFHFSSGVEDWRVADGGACAYFPTGSFATGARLVQAIAQQQLGTDRDCSLRLCSPPMNRRAWW